MILSFSYFFSNFEIELYFGFLIEHVYMNGFKQKKSRKLKLNIEKFEKKEHKFACYFTLNVFETISKQNLT